MKSQQRHLLVFLHNFMTNKAKYHATNFVQLWLTKLRHESNFWDSAAIFAAKVAQFLTFQMCFASSCPEWQRPGMLSHNLSSTYCDKKYWTSSLSTCSQSLCSMGRSLVTLSKNNFSKLWPNWPPSWLQRATFSSVYTPCAFRSLSEIKNIAIWSHETKSSLQLLNKYYILQPITQNWKHCHHINILTC